MAVLLLAVSWACGPNGGKGDSIDGGRAEPRIDSGPTPCRGAECQNFCPDGKKTTLSGTVTAPNGIDPVAGAIVLVPSEIDEIPSTVSCDLCAHISGRAKVQATTRPDGSFSLSPIPTQADQLPGKSIQLVVQKGRFRRVSTVTIDNPCGENVVEEGLVSLPKKSEGQNHVPKIAIATGRYDAMECVLLRMGLDQDAFTIFEGDDYSNAPHFLDALLRDPSQMAEYDVLFLNCGNDYEGLLADQAIRNNLASYVEKGGRLYVTDQAYDFVEQVEVFSRFIDFGPTKTTATTPELKDAAQVGAGGLVVQASILDSELASWLSAIEKRTGKEVIGNDNRVKVEHFVEGWAVPYAVPPGPDSHAWVEGEVSGEAMPTSVRPLTMTFDYKQCGRVLFSSYHTTGKGTTTGIPPVGGKNSGYLTHCAIDQTLTPQERILEYLILHVADCLTIE
ncbi:MAG: hypothetical protein HY698_18685 [Deltaproteobacteria bacterium]|nr:hypothetical protein [Deltaproteobacteria bacterium]